MTNAVEYEITCCDSCMKNLADDNKNLWPPINLRRIITMEQLKMIMLMDYQVLHCCY